MTLPAEAQPLLAVLLPHFTQPTATRFVTRLAAAILTSGRRTVANLLRTLGPLVSGHRTTYQRVLSRAPWSTAALGTALAAVILRHLLPTGPVVLVGDDTVDGHPGPKVYGKARHRDPVRSTHSHTAWRYGHKWVVLAVLVKFPFASRRWALPVLIDLYRAPALNQAEGRRHRTPAQLMCRLLRLFLLRHPGRRVLFVGDSGFGTHEVARFCHRHRDRLTLVSKLHPDANRFDPPAHRPRVGRPPVKGARRRKPREAVARTRRRTSFRVDWYGGGTRRVSTVTESAHWYKAGYGLVPLRWVHVRDQTATHRDEYLYSTDSTLRPADLIGLYCGRWNLETTFQECRSGLGLESTRGWGRATVLRAAPCLFGLYSVVAVLYHLMPDGQRVGAIRWPGKTTVTFSDTLTAVRRWIWAESILGQADPHGEIAKLPPELRELLLTALAPAP